MHVSYGPSGQDSIAFESFRMSWPLTVVERDFEWEEIIFQFESLEVGSAASMLTSWLSWWAPGLVCAFDP